MNYLQVIILFKILVCLSYAFCFGSHTRLTMARIAEIQTHIINTRSEEVAIVPAQQVEGGPRWSQGDTSHWPKLIISFMWKVINGGSQRQWRMWEAI